MNSKKGQGLPDFEPGPEPESSSFTSCPKCVEGFIHGSDGVQHLCECRQKVLSDRNLLAAKVPEPLRSLSTATLSRHLRPLSESIQAAIIAARDYVEAYSKESTEGLLLIGPLDIGRAIAAAILNDLVQKHCISARYIRWSGLLKAYGIAHAADDLEQEKIVFSTIDTPRLVVLDEIGAAATRSSGEAAWDKINILFNTRYAKCLPTIATTTFWNYPPSGPDTQRIDWPGHRAQRITLADQIGGRAWSRINVMTRTVNFNRVDPLSLIALVDFCQTTSEVKGWKLPLYVERATQYSRPVTEVRFDEFGNIYLCCDDHSEQLTNRKLFLARKAYIENCGVDSRTETAVFIQPRGVGPSAYDRFLPATGAILSKVGDYGDQQLTISPYSTELPHRSLFG
jgi:hypothetical protein